MNCHCQTVFPNLSGNGNFQKPNPLDADPVQTPHFSWGVLIPSNFCSWAKSCNMGAATCNVQSSDTLLSTVPMSQVRIDYD